MGFDLLRKEVDSVEERIKRDRKEKVGCLDIVCLLYLEAHIMA